MTWDKEYDKKLRQKRKETIARMREKIVSFMDECDSVPACDGYCPYMERCLALPGDADVYCELTDTEAEIKPSLGFTSNVTLAQFAQFDAPSWTFAKKFSNELGER
jgi:hypothetical protein